MIVQVLGFSAIVILVFGGLVAAVVKFTLTGKAEAKLSERVNMEKYNEAMRQSGLKEASVEEPVNQTNTKQQMRVSHSMS